MSFHTAYSRYKRTIRGTIAEIRDHKKRQCLFDAYAADGRLTETQREMLQRAFDLWWDSWIEPQLEHLACRDKKYVPKEQR